MVKMVAAFFEPPSQCIDSLAATGRFSLTTSEELFSLLNGLLLQAVKRS